MEFLGFNVVLVLIIVLLISIFLWAVFGMLWQRCRHFFHRSYTLVDLLFIFLYFFEQLSLVVILAKTGFNPQIVVGIFSIFVVTTASFQNRAWESRTNLIGRKVIEQNEIIYSVIGENEKVINENKKLNQQLGKSKKFIDELYLELKGCVKELANSKSQKKR